MMSLRPDAPNCVGSGFIDPFPSKNAEGRLMTDNSDPESSNVTVATARKTLYALIARLPDELREEAVRVRLRLAQTLHRTRR